MTLGLLGVSQNVTWRQRGGGGFEALNPGGVGREVVNDRGPIPVQRLSWALGRFTCWEIEALTGDRKDLRKLFPSGSPRIYFVVIRDPLDLSSLELQLPKSPGSDPFSCRLSFLTAQRRAVAQSHPPPPLCDGL